MARYAYPYLFGGAGVSIVLLVLEVFFQSALLVWCVGLCGICIGFIVFFFRDPERVTAIGPDDVVSPADGKVVAIIQERDEDFFQDNVTRISIFLSVFDVHVNRIPFSGTVSYIRYAPGSFLAAFKEEASKQNEHTIIGIMRGSVKVAMKQIAGVIARRVVCTVEEGQAVIAGERCGIIKFGSRADVLLPFSAEILVTTGQQVYGGLTIIGRIHNEDKKSSTA